MVRMILGTDMCDDQMMGRRQAPDATANQVRPDVGTRSPLDRDKGAVAINVGVGRGERQTANDVDRPWHMAKPCSGCRCPESGRDKEFPEQAPPTEKQHIAAIACLD